MPAGYQRDVAVVMNSLEALRDALAAGDITSESLVRACLENAADPQGEGGRVFISLRADQALREARTVDAARARGERLPPFAGIPLSVKDLFDVAGEVTRAGSVLRAQAPPASRTAPAIARLLAAGFIVLGRTNMTEFAYSGVGINPHYGTPLNPWDRQTGRIPGGSSSGAAVSVTDDMAAAGIGTDTGGSCRIPAALTGIAGFKPTASAVPKAGVYPLSGTLDSVGSLAKTAACCAVLHRIMSGGSDPVPEPIPADRLSLAVLDHYVSEDLDRPVATAFEQALHRLSAAGARLTRIRMPEIEALPALNAGGGIAAAEAWAFHRDQIERAGEAYDARVLSRIRAGAEIGGEELGRIRSARRQMIGSFREALSPFQAVLSPTVPVVAPPLAAFAAEEDYRRLNLLLLRNPSLFNFLDACAISLPIHEPGAAPVGLMLAVPGGGDGTLLAAARGVENLFR